MKSSSLRKSVVVLGTGLFLAQAFLFGCGGAEDFAPGGAGGGYKFSETFVGCGDSIDITMTNGGTFPADSAVRLQGNGQDYDGSAVPIQNGKTLVCGFPSGAPKGFYQVILNGKNIGEVQNLCAP